MTCCRVSQSWFGDSCRGPYIPGLARAPARSLLGYQKPNRHSAQLQRSCRLHCRRPSCLRSPNQDCDTLQHGDACGQLDRPAPGTTRCLVPMGNGPAAPCVRLRAVLPFPIRMGSVQYVWVVRICCVCVVAFHFH
jgi:hypothetical protein